jgi:hypothetical protein
MLTLFMLANMVGAGIYVPVGTVAREVGRAVDDDGDAPHFLRR